MTFQKGNQLWKKSVESRRENKKRMQAFLETIADGGIDAYSDLMHKLLEKDDKDLTKNEREFMDRFEGWREFVAPKLARQEITGKDGEDLAVQLYLPKNATVETAQSSGDDAA